MQTAYISDKMRRISFWEDLEMVAHQAQGGFVCGQHAIRFLPFRAHIEYIRVQLERSGVFCIHSARIMSRRADIKAVCADFNIGGYGTRFLPQKDHTRPERSNWHKYRNSVSAYQYCR